MSAQSIRTSDRLSSCITLISADLSPTFKLATLPRKCPKRLLQDSGEAVDKENVEISSIALHGLEQAQGRVEQAAGRLASVGAGSSEEMPVDSADLSQEVVSLLAAKNAFAANLGVLKVANEMQGLVLDLWG